MGFKFNKSIGGKYFRVNLGKNGLNSVTFGKRGALHLTTGKTGTRVGTPILPGSGLSYEAQLDKPKKK